MRNYYRIMLGPKSKFAQECFAGNFIGAHYGIHMDLTNSLNQGWRDFNREFIPIYLSINPEKTKVAAGLSCGTLWTIAKGIQVKDIVLCPNGAGSYWVGEVSSEYYYEPDGILPHRRKVQWYPTTINRADMSEGLRNSTGSIGTSSMVTKHAIEIDRLIGSDVVVQEQSATQIVDATVEDASVFALEKHLEDFLMHNWSSTDLGRNYDIYEVDGETGQQFRADGGFIDILAISKDKKELLVVELKKGRASDIVVGQILRYMGYVLQEMAEPGQTVKGVIIALEDDLRIRRALSIVPNIDFFRYEVKFRLFKG